MKATQEHRPPPIPDHELLHCVGRGRCSEVWLARSVTGIYRGVKIIRPDTFDHERPFEREFSGLQKYEPVSRTHPGLVAVLHVGRGDGYFYCVLEVADDQQTGSQIHPSQYAPRTLSSELARRGRLPVAECAQYGLALTAALEHLHQQGLVHRDIKPSNILFIHGAPKFTDLGLVTGIDDAGPWVDTTGYMPPEGPGAVTADIYSLGKVLYDISLGKDREEFPELPTELRELPDAPALVQFNSILLRACASDPQRRFASAAEMHESIAQLTPILMDSGRAGGMSGRALAGAQSTAQRVVILNPGLDTAATDLARRFSDGLLAQGMQVRRDDHRQPSLAWARELEAMLEDAEWIIALWSPESVRSEMLAYGLERTRAATHRTAHPARLVAVRLGTLGPPPRLLELALEGATLLEWGGAHETEAVLGSLRGVIRNQY